MDTRTSIWTWSTGGARAALVRSVVLAMVGLAAWASLLPLVRSNPVFGDESGWIAASSYTADLVLEGKFDWDLWNEPSLKAYGPLNPPVGKLALGLPLRVDASSPSFRRLWNWSLDEEANRLAGNLPPREDFLAARRIAATHAALFAVVVCAIGWAVGGISVGLLAAASLCLHPVWRETGSMVLTDMLLGAVLLATIFPAIRFLKQVPSKLGYGPLVVLGVLVGVSAAIKPTGLVLGGLFAGSVLAYRAFVSRAIRPLLLGGLVVLGVSSTTLVAMDPWLWPSLESQGPASILDEIPAVMKVLRSPKVVDTWESQPDEISGIQALVRPAWILVRAKNWKHLVLFQRTLPSLQWEAPRLLSLTEWITWRHVAFPGQILLVLLGILALWMPYFRHSGVAGGEGSAAWTAPLLFVAVSLVYTMALVILPVPRYLLPLFAILQILSAHGIAVAARLLMARLRSAGR